MIKLICTAILVIYIGGQYVAAECFLWPSDIILASYLNCKTPDLEQTLRQYKPCSRTVHAKVRACLDGCDTCGKAIMCIKNQLDLMFGLNWNCNSFKHLANSCKSSPPEFQTFLKTFIAACEKFGGDFSNTLRAMEDDEVADEFMSYLVAA